MTDRRTVAGAVLFFGAVLVSLVLTAAGGGYGWPAGLVLVAFIAGALLLANSD